MTPYMRNISMPYSNSLVKTDSLQAHSSFDRQVKREKLHPTIYFVLQALFSPLSFYLELSAADKLFCAEHTGNVSPKDTGMKRMGIFSHGLFGNAWVPY